MSHITKEYFEAHPTQPMFEELATFLGVDLSAWEFADGVEVRDEEIEYITVVYYPSHAEVQDKGFSMYGVFVIDESGEWEVQQFGTNQEFGYDS